MGFWTDARVIVTGGSGFLGSFVVEKLEERGAAEIIVPHSSDYDLRDINAIRRLLHDATSKSEIRNHGDPPGSAGRRDRRKPGPSSRALL